MKYRKGILVGSIKEITPADQRPVEGVFALSADWLDLYQEFQFVVECYDDSTAASMTIFKDGVLYVEWIESDGPESLEKYSREQLVTFGIFTDIFLFYKGKHPKCHPLAKNKKASEIGLRIVNNEILKCIRIICSKTPSS